MTVLKYIGYLAGDSLRDSESCSRGIDLVVVITLTLPFFSESDPQLSNKVMIAKKNIFLFANKRNFYKLY